MLFNEDYLLLFVYNLLLFNNFKSSSFKNSSKFTVKMLFKTIVRSFCDFKLLNRTTILSMLKNEKRNSGIGYAKLAKKLNKSEVIINYVLNIVY